MNNSEQGKSKEEIIDDILEGYESHSVMTDAYYYEDLWDKGSISQAMEDYVKAVTPPPSPLDVDAYKYMLTLCLELYEDEPCKLEPIIRKRIKEIEAGYASSLPQSSTEEEKDLWKDIIDFGENFDDDEQGRAKFISELQSTYKISKR